MLSSYRLGIFMHSQLIWPLLSKNVFFPLFVLPSTQCDNRPTEPSQSTSVESIPEVLEDKESSTEQSDTASVHDIDYVNPRGVRFTQSTQRDGERPFKKERNLIYSACFRFRSLKFLNVLSVWNYIELQGDVPILQKSRMPLRFNQLSQLNQNMASFERHGDPRLCSYCHKHGGNHHLGIFCNNNPVIDARLFYCHALVIKTLARGQ